MTLLDLSYMYNGFCFFELRLRLPLFHLLLRSGKLNIVSRSIFSSIVLNPLAPVFLSNAFLAIDESASLVNSSFTFSKPKSFWYCLTKAFFGLVRISINASLLRSSSVAITGNLPTNSGIRPNFKRSSVSSFLRIDPIFFEDLSFSLTSNPMLDLSPLLDIILSIQKAPPHINKIFVVSTCKKSC